MRSRLGNWRNRDAHHIHHQGISKVFGIHGIKPECARATPNRHAVWQCIAQGKALSFGTLIAFDPDQRAPGRIAPL